MNMKTVFALVIAAMVLFCPGYSNAAVLGTIEYIKHDGHAFGSLLGEFSGINFTMVYPLYVPSGRPDMTISLSWDGVTPDDVGRTLYASADTHPNFGIFTLLLTNGVDNSLLLDDGHTMYTASLSSITSTVSDVFQESERTLIDGIQDGVDFEGYTIDSIALTVNEFRLIDLDPFTKHNSHTFDYDVTYTIYGSEMAVPEPVTLVMLSLGGVALICRKRRHRDANLASKVQPLAE